MKRRPFLSLLPALAGGTLVSERARAQGTPGGAASRVASPATVPPATPPQPAAASPAAPSGSPAPSGTSAASAFPGLRAVVLNSRDASVSLIDPVTYTEVGKVDVGKEPHHLYPTPDNRSLIVANAISNDLHLLDPVTGQLQRRIRNIDDPYQIAFSPDRKIFAANALRLDRVDLYDYDGAEFTLAKRIPLPKAPSHLWFSADSKRLFVTLQESDELALIDVERREVAWKINVGKQPAGLLITPDDKHVMVGVMGQDFVNVIDWRTRQSVKKILTGKGAHNFRGLGDGRHVFVTNRVDNSISRLDMQSMGVLDTMSVPGGPDCIEITGDRSKMWVTSRWARQVTVIDLNQRKIVQTIRVGRSPHGIYLHDRAPLL